MSAQLGSAVTLTYWEQGTQQAGGSVQLSYSPPPAVSRKLVGDFNAPWASSAPFTVDMHAVQPQAETLQIDARALWHASQQLNVASTQTWGISQVVDAARHSAWLQFGRRMSSHTAVLWGLAEKVDHAGEYRWGKFGTRLAVQPTAAWGVAQPRDDERRGPWGQFAAHLVRTAGVYWSRSAVADQERYNPWTRFSRTLQPPWVIVVDDGDETAALITILPARFYMTAHSIYAQTLPDLADVPIFDATVSADSGSYCWSLSASGPASLFEQLAPVNGLPAQIKLTLDGIPWVFAVDSLSRTKAFGQSGVRVQGRSLTALIAAPYLRSTMRNNAIDRTAQQLAEDALSGTGITLDWGIGEGATANSGMVDWLVPTGAWSHQGTPLDAVQAIVQSAGGYLQSHRSAATLQARHPYGQRVGDVSGAPWAWGTGAADVELALDALITESVQRKDGADINAVYVSGTSAGVLALVKRTGTAGDALAAMITDPLITHVTAARQRGLSVLGEAGHKYAVSLDLPVLTGAGQPGVLDVGQLVQVNAAVPWRARVRSVSVQAKQPTLRQSVTLERHMETA